MTRDNGDSLPSIDEIGDKGIVKVTGGGEATPKEVVIQMDDEDEDRAPVACGGNGCKETFSKIKKRMISATPCLQLIGAVGTVVGGIYEAILACL